MNVTTCCVCEQGLGMTVSIPGVTEVVCAKAECHTVADTAFEEQMVEAANAAFPESGAKWGNTYEAYFKGFDEGWRYLQGGNAKGPARLPVVPAESAATVTPGEQKAYQAGRKSGAMETLHAIDELMAWVDRAPTASEIAAHDGLWIYQLAPYTEGKHAHVCTKMAVAVYAVHPGRWRPVSFDLYPVQWPNPSVVSIH